MEAKEIDNAQQLHTLVQRKGGSFSLRNQSTLFQTRSFSQKLSDKEKVLAKRQ